MQPTAMRLFDHMNATSGDVKGKGSNKSDQWSLVSGFSKDTAEAWTALGGGPSLVVDNMNPFIPHKQHPTSERIVERALHVVSSVVSAESSYSSVEHNPSRKIAKKRRGQDGLVNSIHHSKSSKEYLRKLQQSLRDSGSEEEKTKTPKQPLLATEQASLRSISNHHPESRRRRLMTQNNRSQSHKNVFSTASGESSSNPYGYGDPDAVDVPAPLRRVGTARRRGSFTKFSLQAAAAAVKATERIKRLQLHQTTVTTVTAQTNDAVVQPRSLEIAEAAMVAAATQRLQGIQSSNYNYTRPASVVPKQVEEELSRGSLQIMQESTNPYGYEDPDAAAKNKQQQANPYGDEEMSMDNNRQATAISANPYGYEDPDAAAQPKVQSDSYGYGDTQQSNPYGYGDSDSDAQPLPQRRHPRPTRRGSVTKFSFEPQTKVVSSEAQTPIAQNKPIKSIRMDIMLPGTVPQVLAAPDLTQPSAGLQAPAWQQPQKSSPFASRKNGILASNRSDGPLRNMQVLLTETDSILSKQGKNIFSDSQLSLEGSCSSIPQVHRSPSRSDSWKSYTSKRSDSGLSLDSNAESLAPDLESLCSISRYRDSSDVPPPPPPPVLKLGTSTPRSEMRKYMLSMKPKTVAKQASFNLQDTDGLREQFQNERSDSFVSRGPVPVMTFPTESPKTDRPRLEPSRALGSP